MNSSLFSGCWQWGSAELYHDLTVSGGRRWFHWHLHQMRCHRRWWLPVRSESLRYVPCLRRIYIRLYWWMSWMSNAGKFHWPNRNCYWMQPEAVCNDICSRTHPVPVKRGASGLSPESVLRTYFRTGEVCSSVPADFPADNTDSTDRAHRKSPCGLRNAICRFRRQRFCRAFPREEPSGSRLLRYKDCFPSLQSYWFRNLHKKDRGWLRHAASRTLSYRYCFSGFRVSFLMPAPHHPDRSGWQRWNNWYYWQRRWCWHPVARSVHCLS